MKDFLTTRKSDGRDNYLVPILRQLLKEYNAVWCRDESLHCKHGTKTEVFKPMPGTNQQNADLSEGPVLTTLRHVYDDLCELGEQVRHSILANTLEPEKDDDSRTRTAYIDGVGGFQYSRDALYYNAEQLQPRSLLPPWFLSAVHMSREKNGAVFDQLNGTVRCGKHVLRYTGKRIAIDALDDDHQFRRDMGHDLSAFAEHWNASKDYKEFIDRVRGAVQSMSTVGQDKKPRRVMSSFLKRSSQLNQLFKVWMPDEECRRFLFALMVSRILIKTEKLAIVIEGPADLGKTCLVRCLHLVGGIDLVVSQPKDAIEGHNKRKQVLNEASLAANGVRAITYDDVRQIDDGYLRVNANGAQAHLNCIGMTEQIVVDDPCMRIISKNPAGASVRATLDIDTRRKIVLIDDSVLMKPPRDKEADELYNAIMKGTKGSDRPLESVSTALFFIALGYFTCYGAGTFQDKVPAPMRAVTEADTSDSVESGDDAVRKIRDVVTNVFLSLYDVSASTNPLTPVDKVRAAMAERIPYIRQNGMLLEMMDLVQPSHPNVHGIVYSQRRAIKPNGPRIQGLNATLKRKRE